MGTLLLISGFPETMTMLELKKLVEKYFGDHELLKIWRDPYREARAVVLFQEIIDLKNSLERHFSTWRKENLVFCKEGETPNIFVRAYNANEFGLIDKLCYLLTKYSRCTVNKKFSLGDNCFEFEIKEDWDTILAISKKEWKIVDTKLTVCPYFDGFKEPFDDQHQQIWKQNDDEMKKITQTLMELEELQASMNLTVVPLPASKNEGTNNENEIRPEQPNIENSGNTDAKLRTYISFSHSLVPKCLKFLKITKAVKKYNCEFAIKPSSYELAEIIGSKALINSIHKLIGQEECKVMSLIASLPATSFKEIEKKLSQQRNCYLVLSEKNAEFALDVTVGNGQIISFQDFVSFLIKDKIEELDIRRSQNDSSQFEDNSFSKEYQFRHSCCIAILEALNLKDSVEKEHTGIKLKYDHGNSKILLIGPCSKTQAIISTLEEEEKKILLDDKMQSFLLNEGVKEGIQKQNHVIDFSDFSKMLVKIDDHTELSFSKYVDSLTQIKVDVTIVETSSEKNLAILTETIHVEEFILSNEQNEFCKMFLEDFKKEKGVKEVLLENHKLRIHLELCHSKLIAPKLGQRIKSIEAQEKDLKFPGLAEFAELHIGQQIIHEVSQSTKCYISVPPKNEHPIKESEEKDADYTFIFLHTAKCEGINIHLVQGHIEDIKAQMAINLLPTNEDEISIKKSGLVHHNIFLPEWGKDFTDLENLKESLNEKVQIIFEQALHCEHTEIAFSMENLQNAPYPFPLDLLARTILSNLLEYLNVDMGATSARPEFNVYICEPNYEPVFKAFQYFIKKYGCIFGPPDQEKWDHISLQNSSTYSEYSQNTVEIKSSNETWVMENSLFCYPILPSLEANTCPVINETGASLHSLENSLKDIEDEYPDGISISNLFPVRCFPGNFHKDVVLYCCPNWGLDSAQAIYESLKKCLIAATNKFSMHIVPPGVQPNSQYPAKYLAQAVFKALDTFFKERLCTKRLKIYFIIEDFKYRKAFTNELDKRSPKKRNFLHRVVTYFTSGKKTDSPIEKTSTVETSPVLFVSDSTTNISRAVSDLKSKLNGLMSQSALELNVPNNETGIIQRLQNEMDSRVSWEINTDVQHNYKSNQSKSQSKITLQGLHRPWVVSVFNMLQRLEKKSTAKSASSSVDNSSNKDDEKSKNIGQNKRKHVDDSSTMNPIKKEKPLGTSSSMSNSKTKKESKKKKKRSQNVMEHGKENTKDSISNAEQTTCPIAQEQKKEPKFTWKHESKMDKIFENFSDEAVELLETYYILHFAPNKPLIELFLPFKSVDFLTMELLTTEDEVRTILRSEILKPDTNITFPSKWKMSDNEELATCKVLIDHETFNLEFPDNDLSKALTQLRNFKIIKIEQIQNKELYSRHYEKCTLMLQPNKKMLWHRVSENNAEKVCQLGFHRIFSSLPVPKDFSDHGLGVPFTSKVENCFNAGENKGESDIFLIYAEVLTGESKIASGKKQHRSSPVDKTTGKIYDSINDAERFMVFSDAQAYPTYLIQLVHKSKKI